MSPEEQIREIDQQIKKAGLMDAPGTILLGLGLYAKFAANGDAFHPLLNDPSVVNGMLALGAVICVWGAYKVITLRMKRSALKKQHNI